MTRTNQAATDYQYGFTFSSDSPTTNPLFVISTTEFQFTEVWGNAFVSGAMGMQITVVNSDHTPSPDSYRIQAVTPWFSYDSGAQPGWASSGQVFFWAHGAKLVINPDCTWTYSFGSLELWGQVNGAGLTLLASTGAQSISGTGYDERLNYSGLDPSTVLPAFPTGFACPVLPSAGSWSGGCWMRGGYRYGSWTEDPVTTDGTTVSGATCVCFESVPGIVGSTSYNVQVAVTLTGTAVLGGGSVTCPASCSPNPSAYVTQTTTILVASTNVLVKGRAPNLRSQTVATAWDCDTSSGTTSGSSTVTSSTASTTCASMRSIAADIQLLVCVPIPSVCNPPDACPPPPVVGTSCVYNASATLSWPTALACMLPGFALGYDVSLFGEHCVAVSNGSTSDILLGVAGNVLPQTWSFLDTGLSGTWARPRYQDFGVWPIGLFYGDGSNCYWAHSYDDGATWSSLAMGSGVVGDYDEGSDGLRWFFKVISGAVWGQVLDAQLNVVRAWTATNVTGVDDSPIACRESPGSDGSWRIGLWYSAGGAAEVKFSMDGLNFS